MKASSGVRTPVQEGVGVGDVDWARAIVGLIVFFAPGAAWTWALLRHLGWMRAVPVAAVLAFTIEPFAMLALNLVFGVPVNLATGTYLSVALALAGVAVGIRRGALRVVES